jgi:hypothetical protein
VCCLQILYPWGTGLVLPSNPLLEAHKPLEQNLLYYLPLDLGEFISVTLRNEARELGLSPAPPGFAV